MKKKITLGLAVLVFGIMAVNAGKLYGVKSAKIDYETRTTVSIMGVQKRSTEKKRFIFEQYGMKSVTDKRIETRETIHGQSKVSKKHTMIMIDNGIMYSVDFDRKKIMRMENMAMAMSGDMTQKGMQMIRQMGGKKVGTDAVLGYPCDVWEVMGSRLCIHKGITLRIESNMMGTQVKEVATKIALDVPVAPASFQLPDYPIADDMGGVISRDGLKKRDQKTHREMKKTKEDLALVMNTMVQATHNAGVTTGQRPTPQQEEVIKNSMMNAMLPRMKQEFLSQEKMMRFAKHCFSQAQTLKQANGCGQKMNAMSGEDEEPLAVWNRQKKKEFLADIDRYLDIALPCVKKANSMQAVQQCMQ